MDTNERIEYLAKTLGISIYDAEKLVNDDTDIDHGKRCGWEPTLEQELEMKNLNKLDIGRKPIAPKNKDKQFLLNFFFNASKDLGNDVEINNANHSISFHYKGSKYVLKLTRHNF